VTDDDRIHAVINGPIRDAIVQVGVNNVVQVSEIYLWRRRPRRSPRAIRIEPDYEERTLWRTEVDAFLGTRGGYLVVEGAAGVGKTTFLRNLAATERFPAAFVDEEAAIGDALVELADRLVSRWKLPRRLADDVDLATHGLETGVRLAPALSAIFAAATERAKGPVVVVLDGFTSNGPSLGDFLPRDLPDRVYAIVGQRNGRQIGLPGVAILDTTLKQNAAELRQWIMTVAQAEPLAAKLQADNVSPASFADILAGKAGSVWIYAHYVLSDVGHGRLSPATVATLPRDLWGYFKEYFGAWSQTHLDTWENRDLPSLATLAAIATDLTVEEVASVIAEGDAAEQEIEALYELLGKHWLAFLSHPRRDVFSCYHASLRDFVSGSLPTGELGTEDRAFREHLERAFKRANVRLAAYYHGRLDRDAAQQASRSALRSSAAHHYAAAEALDGLDSLLVRVEGAIEDFGSRARLRNGAFDDAENDGEVGEYLRIARVATEMAFRTCNEGSISSARVVRYAIIGSSISSMATNLPAGLLRAALKGQVWTPVEVLRQIAATQSQHARAEKLAEVLPHMIGDVLNQGAEMLAQAGMSKPASDFLRAMAPRLGQLSERTLAALLEALDIGELGRCCPTLCGGTVDGTLLVLRRVLADQHMYEDYGNVVRMCGELGSQEVRQSMVREILNSHLDNSDKALALAELVPLLASEPYRTELGRWIIGQIPRGQYRFAEGARALGRVAIVLPHVLDREERSDPKEDQPTRRRWTRPFGRGSAVRTGTDRPRPVPQDSEWLAWAHCAAAEAAATDDEEHAHALIAYEAITAIPDDTYTRGELLVMLATSSARYLDMGACLNEIPRIDDELRHVFLERLLPWLTAEQCTAVMDWACVPEWPLNQILEVLLPRLRQEQLEELLDSNWPDEPEHRTVERHRNVLGVCDVALIGSYLDASVPQQGAELDHDAARRLEAVCAAPKASSEQIEVCVQCAIDDYQGADRGYAGHHELLSTALPRMEPARMAEVAEQLGLFVSESILGRTKVLVAIADTLPARLFPDVLATARGAGDVDRLRMIGAIAERLPHELLLDAIDIARGVGDDYAWSEVVAATLSATSADARRAVARATWPFRPDRPKGSRDVFIIASEGLSPEDGEQMVDALRQESIDDSVKTSESSRIACARALLGSLGGGSAEVAERCAVLAMEHELLLDPFLLRALLKSCDKQTRIRVTEHVLARASIPGALEDYSCSRALVEILPWIPEEQFLTVAGAAMDAPVAVLIGLVGAWPDTKLDQITQLIPAARAAVARASEYSAALQAASAENRLLEDWDEIELTWPDRNRDHDWSVQRAIVDRCGGQVRQELIDEVVVNSHIPTTRQRQDEARPIDMIGPEVSVATASRLRATTLADDDRTPDYLIAALAAKLPVGQAIELVRDAVEVATPAMLDDASRIINQLRNRLSEGEATELLSVICTTPDELSYARLAAALAPALSADQARQALTKLAEGPLSTGRLFPGQDSPATAFVKARHALATRLPRDQAEQVIDNLLECAAQHTPDWAARFVPDLILDASSRGCEAVMVIAEKLHGEDAATVYLAVAESSRDTDVKGKALGHAVERLRRTKPGKEVARLLARAAAAAAKLGDPTQADQLIREAIAAAQECSSWRNERSIALLEIARSASTVMAVNALTQAIVAYESPAGFTRFDTLMLDLVVAVSDLGSSADRLVASVAYASRNDPREKFLSRLTVAAWGAAGVLGSAWADEMSVDLTNARMWWP
jgi:hypothetical protein